MVATRCEIPRWECVDLMVEETVGRICVFDGSYPLAFPVNYRVVREGDDVRVAFRTAPGSAIAEHHGPASLEVDHIDDLRANAWSVIARGSLQRVVGQHELPDTFPLLGPLQQWMVLDVSSISGRRFRSQPDAGSFEVAWQMLEG